MDRGSNHGTKAEFRLDVLIKREEDYYVAHCLQFDIVATADTLDEVRKGVIDLCKAHIEYSYENDNLEYLFSPAPKEIWSEYLATFNKDCDVEQTKIESPPAINPFCVQEVYYYA